ncbi:MAG: sigma-70 family RNA polymerase sigma factor [Blastocatellia bacterium]|nr:sigma-70 family RNA polymerase sigma factor [Blastocatellia bacterium]
MVSSEKPDLTQLLVAWSNGDEKAHEELIPLVYNELRRLAHSHLLRERYNPLLQTTALVHEAYLKLIDAKSVRWQDRAHFFRIAARMMRQILVDHARSRDSSKRGGDVFIVTIEGIADIPDKDFIEITILNDLLERLQKLDTRQCEIVELRFFGGMTNEEISEVLQVSPRTIKREWSVARAWLLSEMKRA